MSLELTKLKSENNIYIVEGDPYTKVLKRIWRDMTIKSYKWRMKIVIISYLDYLSNGDSEEIVLECKNYTRDTLSRRFKDWRETYSKPLKLEKIEQFFFTD